MLKTSKTLAVSLSFAFLQLYSLPASADWFLSAETKALIAKAEAGDVGAQMQVAGAYDTGRGAPHDKTAAIKWYRMASEAGNVEAQNSVGSLLQEDKKYAEALSWYEKAAGQGSAQAINNMAYLYDLGLGVPQDRKKGFDLYSRAAELGFAEAMWNIANMYGAGQLGQVDLVMACVWTSRAARYAGPKDKQLAMHLTRVMPRLHDGLSREQLVSCHEQAEAWTPSEVKR
jgi:hypothetical protein